MDDVRFDDWTRSLVVSASRRVALKTLAGGALGALLMRVGVAEGEAACAPHGTACKGTTGGCCSGFCEHTGKCSKNGKLTGKCRCRCPEGTTKCGTKRCCGAGAECQGGQCVPAAGACAPACTPDRTCEGGQCVCPPEKPHAAPERYCDETCRECCIDSHCHPTKSCSHPQGSICVCVGSGNKDCGGGFCQQCCTEDDCYANHNWSGGHVICTAPGSPGGGGLCRCDEGFAMCGGAPKFCTNTKTDSFNCGFCGNRCWNGTTCIEGECRLP